MSGQTKRSWRSRFDVIVGIAMLVVAVPSAAGPAQLGYLWSFDELTTKADCVVIAEHARTHDSGRRATHPELTPAYPVIELETALKLLAVLKPCGRTELKAGTVVTLKHYTPDRERMPSGLMNTGSHLTLTPGAAYLMFLKHSEGTVFEPLSGHTFPTSSAYPVSKQL
jgi:hypothetical protein